MTRRRPFDLAILAPNGLRRGFSTGSAATAAVKAALLLLLRNERASQVEVSLPDPDHYLLIPIHALRRLGPDCAEAEVIKQAGDDPDVTDGARIVAMVLINQCGDIRFRAGPGVGTVTAPGIRVPVGEPAINPVPRQMMRMAVDEVLAGAMNPGFDLVIGCVDGAEIARKTFNPRLGIVGGISILGTSGIVEPMSMAAWMASIEVYIRVALGDRPTAIAFTPGKIGKAYARDHLRLPAKQVVQIANFVGAALDYTQQTLEEMDFRLDTLWVLGHPGKIAKVLDGVWDTHSGKSGMAMQTVAAVAADCGFAREQVQAIEAANTVENVIEMLRPDPAAPRLWRSIEQRSAELMQARVPAVRQVAVRLFAMNGQAIGAAA
ncbi:cobalt-precorrin-5B (C(1))-methyltransferase CbiD [Thermithiobacillus plumbiphilus]|uniref:Cobalt-precorrin-5B C(1)-methyltransferase n=1 Tax=Thermithiobacillus plumbiphilus TaxID=1729899 RepID=A0ABU9D6Q2_9PROT